ncbi:hypothetical protein [Candidatus Desulfofervidus auxilii]|nr:hypothetical protein [Candidatus Desulfofervidus auxilii]
MAGKENMKDSIQKIYLRIQTRKLKQITEIEEILTPLQKEHPEVKKVLDIIHSWKPKLGYESGGIRKGIH